MSASLSASGAYSRNWRDFVATPSVIRFIVVAVLIFLVFRDVILNQLAGRWLNDANWSHGWLIPMFSLYFLASRRRQLAAAEAKPGYWGAVLLALSLTGFFVSAWRLRMGYPQAVALVGTILGVVWLLGGRGILRVAWFPVLFLLLAIPLPQAQYVSLTMPLRKLASQVAAAVMPLFASGLHTEAQSVVIDYIMPGRGSGQLNVEEACSGMRSIMAFVTLGVAMAYLNERPGWQRAVLMLCCVPIAVLCNAIRVTVTGLLYVYGLRDWAQGTPHTLLGILLFGLALGLFGSIGYVIGHLYVESREEGDSLPVSGSQE